MKILFWRLLEGVNIYSFSPVLLIRVAIGQYEYKPSNAIEGFVDRLVALLPGLMQHHCSRGYEGGFVERLREGTYLAHIFEHVILELQHMAGYNVKFGKTRQFASGGVYNVIVGYEHSDVAVKAMAIADEMLNAILKREKFDIAQKLLELKLISKECELGPSTGAIYEAAVKRGIPVTRVGKENFIILGHGCKQQRIWATITSKTGCLASDLACDKEVAKQLLRAGGLPVPYGRVVKTEEELFAAMEQVGVPVAIKPVNANHGKGVNLHVTNIQEARQAFKVASGFDDKILVEEFITGKQYRMCVINGKMVAAAERIPPMVIGDGRHTVSQLVDIVNRDSRRGDGHEKPLTKIKIDDAATITLAKQNLSFDSIPENGRQVYIRDNANLSAGGTAMDVTDLIHPENVKLAERAVKLIGLDVAGVDIVAEDIATPIEQGRGAIIEINSAPGIRMHHYPTIGQPRNIASAIIDYLYPGTDNGRIPLCAITGTNGKTTVTRMVSHILELSGKKIGMTTTDGIYVQGECIVKGDTTGPDSARAILMNPEVEVAVLELARGGIVRRGLAFRNSDVGVITNISEDHFGQDGIKNLDDIAYIKSLIVETVKPDGFAVLNADDSNVRALAARVKANIVYFSLEPDNITVRRHLGAGGTAFFMKDGMICGATGRVVIPVIRMDAVPVTHGGFAVHNVQNALVAATASYCMGAPVQMIREGLASFAQNHGRFNLIDFRDFRVCLDYGHNPDGYRAVINAARRFGASRFVGVIGAPGDRCDDTIINVGRMAGLGFDFVYIKEDCDLRGRSPGETAALLQQGAMAAGLPFENVIKILPEGEAVRFALENALPGDFIVVFFEEYDTVWKEVQDFQAKSKALVDCAEQNTRDNLLAQML